MARISYLQGSVLQGAYIPSLLLTDRVESQYHVWGGIHSTWDFSAPLKEISGWSRPLVGIHGNERKHKTGNQPKRKGETAAPRHILSPLGRLHWSCPSQYRREKTRRKWKVGGGGKGKQMRRRRKQLPSQLSQGTLLTLNGATGEMEMGGRPEGGSCTQAWLHTEIPAASWPAIRLSS